MHAAKVVGLLCALCVLAGCLAPLQDEPAAPDTAQPATPSPRDLPALFVRPDYPYASQGVEAALCGRGDGCGVRVVVENLGPWPTNVSAGWSVDRGVWVDDLSSLLVPAWGRLNLTLLVHGLPAQGGVYHLVGRADCCAGLLTVDPLCVADVFSPPPAPWRPCADRP